MANINGTVCEAAAATPVSQFNNLWIIHTDSCKLQLVSKLL